MEIGYVAAAAAAVVVAVIFWHISVMNRFERLPVKITEPDSGIRVALTKRYDALTKMPDVAKAYAKHEAEKLAGIVKLRAGFSIDKKAEAYRQMDEMTGRINILSES